MDESIPEDDSVGNLAEFKITRVKQINADITWRSPQQPLVNGISGFRAERSLVVWWHVMPCKKAEVLDHDNGAACVLKAVRWVATTQRRCRKTRHGCVRVVVDLH